MSRSVLTYILKVAALAAIYFVTAYGGLKLDPVGGFATLVWAPTGISLAALLIFGPKLWPGVFLAALAVNYYTGAAAPVALGIAVGNTLEAFAGAYILKRLGFHNSLSKLEDALGLVVVGALTVTLISATIGTSSLLLGGTIAAGSYGATWLAWWVGDALGSLVVAPLLLTWSANRISLKIDPPHLVEFLVWAALSLSIGLVVFHNFFFPDLKKAFLVNLIFPAIIWSTLRFNQRINTAAVFVLSTLAIWGTVSGGGPFKGERLSENLLYLQIFMGMIAATVVVFGAVVAERRKAEQERQRLTEALKDRIDKEERVNKIMVEEIKRDRSQKLKPIDSSR